MGHFLWTGFVFISAAIVGIIVGYPVDDQVTFDMHDGFGIKIKNESSCHHKGVVHQEGEVFTVEEPCLSCICRRGSLACHLQICPDIPEPLPEGCVVLHKQNLCCPQVLCEAEHQRNQIEVRTEGLMGRSVQENENGCIINGSLYAEGSALASSSLCEYCYCIRGQQKCIRPLCTLPLEGCSPSYREHSCCPTHYHCGNNAVNASLSSLQPDGCMSDGVLYPEGEMVVSANSSSCENCYCMKGSVRCVAITCPMDLLDGCQPVRAQDQCCPSSFVCSKEEKIYSSISNLISYPVKSLESNETISTSNHGRSNQESLPKSTVEPEIEATTEEEAFSTESTYQTTTEDQEGNSTETTTLSSDTEQTPAFTQNYPQTEMQERIDQVETSFEPTGSQETISETTTTFDEGTTAEPEVTTFARIQLTSLSVREGNGSLLAVTLQSKMDVEGSKVSSNNSNDKPSVASEEPSASQPIDDYPVDYDYNEPRLPPSLPNLIIFPFVAADAVVKDQNSPSNMQSNKRADVDVPEPEKNYFSPPAETEGGFIPKEPSALNEEYDPYLKGENVETSIEESPGIIPPPITMPPHLKSENCISQDREYRHGELLSEAGECTSCVCFYGEVICQEATCPTVKPGCKRMTEKEIGSCCGKVICEAESLIGVTDKPHSVQEMPDPVNTAPVSPAPVAEALDVTFAPFKTELISDSPPLTSDMVSPYVERHTKKPVSVTYKNVHVDYYPDFQVTTTRDSYYKGNEKHPVYYSTELYSPVFGTRIKGNSAKLHSTTEPISHRIDYVPVRPSTKRKPSVDEYNLTTSKTSDTSTAEDEDTSSKFGTSTIEATADSPGSNTTQNATEDNENSRTSIRPVVLKTTEPSRQVLNQTTATIERITVRTTKKPTRVATKRPLISIKPKPNRRKTTEIPTSSEASFFDEFLKDFFESSDTVASTFTTTSTTAKTPATPKHKYSSKIKSHKTSTTSPIPSLQNKSDLGVESRNGTEDSYSLDSMLQMLFNSESSTTTTAATPSTIRTFTRTKYRNTTRRPLKKTSVRKPVRLSGSSIKSTVTTPTQETQTDIINKTTTETPVVISTSPKPSGFSKTDLPIVTSEKTNPPKANIFITSVKPTTETTSTTIQSFRQPSRDSVRKPTKTSQDLGGILKLAGCNIYGRMYRVGKIITELSGPCLECMCTDMGVQCAELTC